MNTTEPFGCLSNGAQILGTIDSIHPSKRTGIVSAQIGDDWRLSAQDNPDLIYIEGEGIDLGEVTIEQLNRLRSLLATDLPEQLIAAAVAYARGDVAPALVPTYAETASDPEMQARFNSLSPAAKRVASGLVALMDKYGAADVEQTLDLVLGECDDDDDPVCTVIDDGERSGIRLERYDQHERGEQPRAWLDFRVGSDGESERVLVSTYLYGSTQQGLQLIIDGTSINDELDEVWTLADVRRLRDDLDRLLRDQRLLGALAEQEGQLQPA